MSNLFQSSAKASSVESNTIKVENAAEGILRESQSTLKKMSRQLKAEEAVAIRHTGHLEKKFIAEQQDRQRTRKWEMELSKSFIDAVKLNHQTKIDEATNRVKHANKGVLSELQHLAPTIASVWNKVDAKREKDGKAFGQMLAFKYNITTEDYGDQQGIKGHLKEKAGANNSLRNKMREAGASWDEIEQASKLNGYERLGLSEGIAIRAGRDYGSWETQRYSDVIELGNGLGRHSKASAIASGNERILKAIDTRLLSDYLNQPHLKNLNSNLLVTHARDKILNYQARGVSALREKNTALIQENTNRKYREGLWNELEINGPKGVFDHIETISGGEKVNRPWAVAMVDKHLVEMAGEGRITNDFIVKLANYEFMPGVKYGERNWQKIEDIIKAKDKYDFQQRELWERTVGSSSTGNKMKSIQLEAGLTERYDEVTNKELMTLYTQAVNIGNKPMQDMLQRLMKVSNESINDIANVPHLEKLLVNGMLTKKAVIDARLTPKSELDWLKKAKENSPFVPDDDTDALFKDTGKRAIEQILQSYGVESKYILSSKLAADTAHNDMRQYYKMGMIKFQGNKEEAKKLALQMFQADLQANDKYHITERTTINGNVIQNPHFTKHHLPAERISYPASEFTTEMVRDDPDMWQTKPMMQGATATKWIKEANSGRVKGFPEDALHLCEKYGWDILEFLESQAKLHDPDLELDKKWHAISKEAHSRIRPEYLPFLKEGPVGVQLGFQLSQTRSLRDPSVLSAQARELMGVR